MEGGPTGVPNRTRERSMRRIARIIAVAALALLVASAAFGINPDNLNRVTFVNHTGYDIRYLFFSPGDSEYWGANILGTTRTLDDGEKLSFYIHYPDYSNAFDFMAIDEDGDAYLIWDYEISDDRSATIEITMADYDGGYDMPEFTEVQLTNDSGYDIHFKEIGDKFQSKMLISPQRNLTKN